MLLFYFVTGYISLALALHFLMAVRCGKNSVFRAPKSRFVFYFLSFTWGFPCVFAGCIAALIIRITGHKAKKYGWEWYFEFSGITWGLEMGLFFIVPAGNHELLKMHEHGHGIQNIYFGIFNPLVTCLPSVTRFWYRKVRQLLKKPCKSGYDDAWFEGSATASGSELMRRLRENNK